MGMTQAIPESIRQAFERTEHPFHMWEGLQSTPEALATILEPPVQAQIAAAAEALAAGWTASTSWAAAPRTSPASPGRTRSTP